MVWNSKMNKNKKIVCLVGCSGSGKSTWARKFLEQNPDYIYLNADTLRLIIAGDESNQDKNFQVFQTLEHMAAYFMYLGKNILVDNTSYNRKNRLIWNRLATAHGYEKTWVVFRTGLEQCIQNNEKRKRRVPIEIIKKQHENLTIPLDEGGEIVYIGGH
jgi:predicted kinase